MESIRTHAGPVFLCSACGQPCYEGAEDPECGSALQHFQEQWDGVRCATFPLAAKKIEVDWLPVSLDDLRARYPGKRREVRVLGAAC